MRTVACEAKKSGGITNGSSSTGSSSSAKRVRTAIAEKSVPGAGEADGGEDRDRADAEEPRRADRC